MGDVLKDAAEIIEGHALIEADAVLRELTVNVWRGEGFKEES